MAGRVNGLAVAYTAAGFVLLWSGWQNTSLKDTLTSFAQGKVPRGTPAGAPTLSIGQTAGQGGSPGGSPSSHVRTVGGTANQTQWAKAFLSALGVPETSANVDSVVAWEQREGGGGANNPLNTTQREPGSTSFNSVGVQNYPSVSEGITATVTTIRNGYYNDILAYLRSGKGFAGVTLRGLSTWSGGGYSSVG